MEKRDLRQEIGDGRPETGDGDWRQEAGHRRQDAGDRRLRKDGDGETDKRRPAFGTIVRITGRLCRLKLILKSLDGVICTACVLVGLNFEMCERCRFKLFVKRADDVGLNFNVCRWCRFKF